MNDTTAWAEDHFIAGDSALDFANTVYRRWPEPGADLFTTIESFGTWLVRAGLVPTAGSTSDAVLDKARALRSLLWEIFDAQSNGRPISAAALSALLDTAREGSARITVSADGSMTSADVDGVLAVLALRAIRLVLHPPPQGVRACARCGWFFIDSSRGRRRRWCSMKTCGNQAKAARYRSAHS